MKYFERIIIVVGLATLAVLLWKFDAAAVWALVCRVGWGFLVILPMQIFDHALNAVGWRYAFAARDSARVPFWQLLRVRVAGDGVNYLTPSATIAGEIVRPGMLAADIPAEVRNASVVVAKFAQSLGMAFFALLGMLVLIPLRLGFLSGGQIWAGLAGSAVILVLVAVAMTGLAARRRDGSYLWPLRGQLAGLRDQTARYLRAQPARFALSTFFFMIGFAWGAWEVMVICYFLGVPMDAVTALSVEVLSVVVDSVFIAVPAKIGTQEAGKTAIFAGLGLPASSGLAFGVVRHMRELAWAAAGFALYASDARARRRPSAPLQARCAPRTGSAVPGD